MNLLRPLACVVVFGLFTCVLGLGMSNTTSSSQLERAKVRAMDQVLAFCEADPEFHYRLSNSICDDGEGVNRN